MHIYVYWRILNFGLVNHTALAASVCYRPKICFLLKIVDQGDQFSVHTQLKQADSETATATQSITTAL